MTALDLRLSANSSDPLIPAQRRVARLSCFGILPSARKDILSSAEKVPEECDLLGGRRGHRYACGDLQRLFGRLICLRTLQHTQLLSNFPPFPIECGHPPFQGRNLSCDVVRAGDRILPFKPGSAPESLSVFPWQTPNQF